jgi:type III secretory pathway component EscR
MLSPPADSVSLKLPCFATFDGWVPLCRGVAGSFR